MTPSRDPLAGISVLERGWLSSNNVVLHGRGDGDGAVLVDSGHVLHAPQTLALVHTAVRGEALTGIVNTHLHSDHCGGNATLARELGCRITIPPGLWAAARAWDEAALSYAPTGQLCERFVPDAMLAPGQALHVGTQEWQALAAPGHDPHAIILFNAATGVLISADALWANRFGVVFPELEGNPGFDDTARTLDLIESLDARWVIPGHGAPFDDVPAALQRARGRLAHWRTDPARHARHALKALLKYHLMEVRRQPWPALRDWLAAATLYGVVWQRLGRPAGSLEDFARGLVAELAASGALALRDDLVCNL